MTLSINPGACVRSLPANERGYLGIPKPQWLTQDPLHESFSRYTDLWFGGTVVWGRVVQANGALYDAGDADHPGELVYDPTGTLGPAELSDIATKLFALKHTTPADPGLRALADHFTSERTRARGMRVPPSISQQPVLVT